MWGYEKKLQYPVKIKNPDPATAKLILTQLGGPDGELGAATRYLNQRYTMPYKECKGILTDIGTEGALWHPQKRITKSRPGRPGAAVFIVTEIPAAGH